MNMIKTVTVASVLAAASIAQADVLFDSLSTFDTSRNEVIESQVVGMPILTQDSLRGSTSIPVHFHWSWRLVVCFVGYPRQHC
jgi:Trk-type K+ transport system membrane component